MSRVLVKCFGVSLDGFGAGPNQSLENPLGERGKDMMSWFFPTKVFRAMTKQGGGETGVDNAMAEEGMKNMGAWILGRNMFGPVRGPWPDESWKGWWGDEPPYHVPTFVLTHHKRGTIPMKGGTDFIFVTEGIETALERAREAAGDRDIRIGGGVSTVRQYLQKRLVDELHLVVRPFIMGSGENLFQGLDLRALGYQCDRHVAGERAMHVFLRKES